MGSAAPPAGSAPMVAKTASESPIHDLLFMRFLLLMGHVLMGRMGPAAPALSPANHRQPCLRGDADLFLAQRSPDVRAQMHEALQIHDVLDALVMIPSLGVTYFADIEDFLDPSRASGHHCDAVGQIYRLVHGVRDEENRARIDARDAHQLLLHHDARLRIEGTEWFVHQ